MVDVINLQDYNDAVYDYLEYMGLPEYVEEFNSDDIARTFAQVILTNFKLRITVRMTALIIFGFTWDKIKNNQNIGRNPYEYN